MKKFFIVAVLILLICTVPMLSSCANPEDAATSTVRLNIATYAAGKNQPTHPAVIGFEQPWQGYRYWMSYTPFPYANGEEENPCIAVSNDLFYWQTPSGLANPIAYNEETGCNELKDAHILYREDLDRLELWYLGRLSPDLGGDGQTLLMLRKCSTDGVHWSDYERMRETAYLSPSLYWDGEKYRLWEMQYELVGDGGTLAYLESTDGFNWSVPKLCDISGTTWGLKLWHGSVRKIGELYYLVYIKDYLRSPAIYCCTSKNGIDFSSPVMVVRDLGVWHSYYRPDLLYQDGCFYLFYGVITDHQQRYISFSYGKDLDNLQGLTVEDQAKMAELADQGDYRRNFGALLKTLYQRMSIYIHFKLLGLLIVFVVPLGVVLRRFLPTKSRLYRWLLLGFAIFAACGYLLLHPTHAVDYSGTLMLLAGFVQGFMAAAAGDFLIALFWKQR